MEAAGGGRGGGDSELAGRHLSRVGPQGVPPFLLSLEACLLHLTVLVFLFRTRVLTVGVISLGEVHKVLAAVVRSDLVQKFLEAFLGGGVVLGKFV